MMRNISILYKYKHALHDCNSYDVKATPNHTHHVTWPHPLPGLTTSELPEPPLLSGQSSYTQLGRLHITLGVMITETANDLLVSARRHLNLVTEWVEQLWKRPAIPVILVDCQNRDNFRDAAKCPNKNEAEEAESSGARAFTDDPLGETSNT